MLYCLHPLCWAQNRLCVWLSILLRPDCDHGGSCPPHACARNTHTHTVIHCVCRCVIQQAACCVNHDCCHCCRRYRSIKPHSNRHNKAAGFLQSTSCAGRKWRRGRSSTWLEAFVSPMKRSFNWSPDLAGMCEMKPHEASILSVNCAGTCTNNSLGIIYSMAPSRGQ